ncbi:MAG TPA: hypothetical protein VLY04_02910 [Bryobacteraceae bacterium]|nr:hypothetical protein [Bryobacteraceae bacterium]
MPITLESVDKRLQDIGELAAAGDFEQVERQAKVLAEELTRASRPVYPNYKTARSGPAPTWDANHQKYAAALLHVRGALGHAAHADSAATQESLSKARAALAPQQEAK